MLVHRLMLALEGDDYFLLDNLARYLKTTRTEVLRRALREMSDRTGPVPSNRVVDAKPGRHSANKTARKTAKGGA